MKRRVLYYTYFVDQLHPWVSYVVATYSDFDTRVWYPDDPGFAAAKSRALGHK